MTEAEKIVGMRNKKTQNNSDDNSLSIIYEWLRKRLGSEHSDINNIPSEPQHEDTSNLLKQFVNEKIERISAELGLSKKDRLLVTVRKSFRQSQEYLRPVYSDPETLRRYLAKPERQVPFSFPGKASAVFASLSKTYPESIKSIQPHFGALHSVNVNGDNQQTPKDGSNDPTKAFAPRINEFWNKLKNNSAEEYPELHRLANSEGTIYCFFSGRNKAQVGKEKVHVELDHIVAIYFKAAAGLIDDPELLQNIQRATDTAKSLFTGIDLILHIDSSLFKLEGLQLVAQLLPEFSNNNKAPADKVALALRQIKEHLNRHLVGRQGDGTSPEVFYLTASFEKDKNDLFFPRLEMYPHCYRVEYPVGSYQVAHKRNPSATKFLLYQYLHCTKHQIVFGKKKEQDSSQEDWTEAHIHPDFSGLFHESHLKTISVEKWLSSSIWDADKPDQLHMVSHDRAWGKDYPKVYITPWSALNRPADPDRKNNSIVAFIIEGERVECKDGESCKTFPHGVFAIESADLDAFSDDDVKGLAVVISSLASLIRQITHRNSPLDYRASLARAFDKLVPNFGPSATNRDVIIPLIFAVQKLDGKELEKLCKIISDSLASSPPEQVSSILNNYNLTLDAFKQIKGIQEFCPGYDNDKVNERQAADFIDKRVENLRKWLRESSLPLKPTIEFLEACTENFAWAGFLSSLGQALGDRVDKKVPRFDFMTPGYSASRMFMACVDKELRQVVKLSSARKLLQERENYVKYVRYRLVNSARIPVNAFAFDTRGEEGKSGKESEDDLAYGALVSDLVSGQSGESDEVLTLLSIVARTLLGKTIGLPPLLDIGEAMKVLFDSGLILWGESEEISQKITPLVAVRDAFRLPREWPLHALDPSSVVNLRERDPQQKRQNDLFDTHRRFREILFLHNIKKDILFEFWKFSNDEAKVVAHNELVKKSAIIHGDLNARNLTWAVSFKSFFMIDFEHVGPHFLGADQFRLVVNLLVELVGEALTAEGKYGKWKNELFEAIDYGTDFISTLSRNLLDGENKSLQVLCRESLSKDCMLCNLLADLIGSVKSEATLLYNSWNKFWGYVLFCAILKEFEYSCNSIDESKITAILVAADSVSLKLLELGSKELMDFLGKEIPVDEVRQQELGNYFRHLSAAKMLYGICRIYSL